MCQNKRSCSGYDAEKEEGVKGEAFSHVTLGLTCLLAQTLPCAQLNV